MDISFDSFNQFEKPSIVLCNPNKDELYPLGLCYDTKITLRFNAMSEFSFIYPETIDNGKTTNEAYYFLDNKRLVFIDGYGYFQIVNVEESSSGESPIKKVNCFSLENELIGKRVLAFGGTRPLYNVLSPNGTVLKAMSDLCGGLWTVGTVDASLLSLQRTFDVKDTNIYEFLMNDVSKAFDCIFIFDTVARTISAKAAATATTQSDIFFSFENLIKSQKFSEISDEICTVLEVRGGADLPINSVNPLGTNKIYNFDYYKNINWMSQSLVDAITHWETLVNAYQSSYAGFLASLSILNGQLLTLQSELATLQEELDTLEGTQKLEIQAGTSITATNAAISAKQLQIDNKNAQIANKNTQINTTKATLASINAAVSFTANFTSDELLELQNFIYENSYLNSNIIQTDSMTPVQIQAAQQSLYDQAKAVLAKIAQPRYEFTFDSLNYIMLPEYNETFTSQTEMGTLVTVEVRDNAVFAQVALLEMEFSFDKPDEFKLVFSNRLRLDNGAFTYSDLLGEVKKTGSAVAFDAEKWSNWSLDYKDDVTQFISSALDAAKNKIINSSNQEITINQNGLRGRTLDPDTEEYDPTQVWLTSSIIAFTDDGWNTAKLALGSISIPGGGTGFGLVADYIVGHMLAGNSLTITNESSTFTLDGNRATLFDAIFSVETQDTKVIIDPSDYEHGIPFRIQRIEGGVWVDRFLVDEFGNVKFMGDLTGANGTFSGTLSATVGNIGTIVIDSDGLKTSDNANYLRGDGTMKWGLLTTTMSSATFTGNIYANNLKDSTDTPVFTSDLMPGDYVYSGTIGGPGLSIGLGSTGLPTINGDTGVILTSGGAGGLEVMATGDTILAGDTIVIAANGITITSGDINIIDTGAFAISADSFTLSSTTGIGFNSNVTMASGKSINLSGAGGILLTGSGDIGLTSGDIILSTGNISVNAGDIGVAGSGGISVVGSGDISANSGDIKTTSGIVQSGAIGSVGINAPNGYVSALGYQITGTPGLTTNVTISGTTLHFQGGILTSVT